MAAEVVKYFFPKFVDLHNYIPANSTPQKFSNWSLLNRQENNFYYMFIQVHEWINVTPQLEKSSC